MPKGKRRWTSRLKQREQINPSSVFGSAQALNRLDDDHPQRGGWSFFLGVLIQMLISYEGTLTDSPHPAPKQPLPAIWASLNPVSSTHKFNHPNEGLME